MPGEGIDVAPPMTVAEAERKRPPSFVRVARSREQPLTGFGTTLAEARNLASSVDLTRRRLSSRQRAARASRGEGRRPEGDAAHPAHPPRRSLQPRNRHAVGPLQGHPPGRLHPQLSGDPGPEGERPVGDLRRRGRHELAGRGDVEGAVLPGQAWSPGDPATSSSTTGRSACRRLHGHAAARHRAARHAGRPRPPRAAAAPARRNLAAHRRRRLDPRPRVGRFEAHPARLLLRGAGKGLRALRRDVPEGMAVSRVQASAEGAREVPGARSSPAGR